MSCAHIDYLGVTFKATTDDGQTMLDWSKHLVRLIFGAEQVMSDTGRGWSGYHKRYDIDGVGLVAFGGNSNTIHIEITGTGCAQVKSWPDVVGTIEDFGGKITRCDVACDDHDGRRYCIDWCKAQYESGGFDPARGIRPKVRLIDDMGTGDGCTFYVGSRESGKLFRGYDKGQQLGDPNSAWFRVEVEYRAVHREIPLQILEQPGAYLAGAYPCLADCDIEQRQVKTFAYSAAAEFHKAIDHARKQAGRAIHAMLCLNDGDITSAFAILHRPELPKRLAGYIKGLLSATDEKASRRPAMCVAHPHDVKLLEKVRQIPEKWWHLETLSAMPQATGI
jgi:phage replication initiation protein